MAKLDPAVLAHLEWLGFVQPTGLVVSAPALVRAGAILDRRDIEGQRLLQGCVQDRVFDPKEGPAPCVPDFRAFAESVLDWGFSSKGYAGTAETPIPPELELPLPDYGETLRPDLAVRELEPKDGAVPWQLLVRVIDPGQDFDHVVRGDGKLEASPLGRMERLLRHTGVPAGVLFNGRALRLVSAPRGESSGWLDFRVADMIQTSGRPISTAVRLLLRQARLLSLPRQQRLAALLEDSRKFQNEVSERLAEQVLHALYELLRGFQAAHDSSKGELLREPLAEHPDEVYRALLTVILRLVFLLYAEERSMLPEDETFLRHYSLAGLYERLREDAALNPDTMDQRFGAWAQLLVLFRLIHGGADTDAMQVPKRHGVLFDPDRFKFLEGRKEGGARQIHERIEPPLVPDGTIYRALEKLLVLDGERISYRALDVEQIGSVYETMMGFRLETATGRSVAVRAQKKHGAPTAVDLEVLLAQAPAKREKWIRDRTDRKLTDKVKKTTKDAATIADLHAALLPVIDLAASPDLVPKGAMVLQPSEERRRSGSHYTPRALTEPIVRTTLEPILARLRGDDGGPPRAEQILDLKVCDPAMGSGAFLVEACRQLGDALVEAWRAHESVPEIPSDEDEVIFARRLVAQRCLYGVDRNPVAVDLAKMSLWLVTLARDHALTFVDHALRHGDSLVGLSKKQIEVFHWDTSIEYESPFRTRMREQLKKVAELRRHIREAGESVSDWELRDMWDEAVFKLRQVRLFGDLVLAAHFEGDKSGKREARRSEYVGAVVSEQAEQHRGRIEEWRHTDPPFAPFHWEIEFPEVFERDNSGFDAIVGNPPFAGKNSLIKSNVPGYLDCLRMFHEGSHGAADLVAHFFRRGFKLLRGSGTLGLIATNTISQGDTRTSGLSWICDHGGSIYAARRRFRWPGQAAVVVSIVWLIKGSIEPPFDLDGRPTQAITAYLFHVGGNGNPATLLANRGKSFKGCELGSLGFVITPDDPDFKWLSTTPDPVRKGQKLLKPYLGGEDLNNSPTIKPPRFVVDTDGVNVDQMRALPRVLSFLTSRLRADLLARGVINGDTVEWWHFRRPSREFRRASKHQEHILGISEVTTNFSFAFVPTTFIPAHTLKLFGFAGFAAFAIIQSRAHEIWARFFGSSMKDDLRYTPSDCFETFPFPEAWETHSAFEDAGKTYYEYRADLMVENDEGLTKTYNRFHDPEERNPRILKLRELHTAMDRVVFNAYGWTDIPIDCEFLLDYEIDEEEWGSKKKPWRYRWPDEIRDEVLARLLELNSERASEETRSGAAATKQDSSKRTANRESKKSRVRKLFP